MHKLRKLLNIQQNTLQITPFENDDDSQSQKSNTDSAYGLEEITRIDFINLLPYEVSVLIFSFINDIKTILNILPCVSKQWNLVSNDMEILRNVYYTHWPSKFDTIEHSAEYYTPISRASSSIQPEKKQLVYKPSKQAPLSINWKNLLKSRLIVAKNWKTKQFTKRTLIGHEDSVYCIQFDDEKIVSGSRDRSIKMWDFKTLNCLKTLTGHDGSVLCLHYDDKHLVSGSSDSTIILWDMHTFARKYRLIGHASAVLDIRLSETRIVSCSKDWSIKVWNVSTGELIHTMMSHSAAVNAIHLHKNILASASGDCVIKLWNIETGTLLRDLVGHSRGLACIQFDGEKIVSGSNDKTIRIWNAASGECIKEIESHSKLVRTLCFDSEYIVTGSYDESIKCYGKEGLMFEIENAHTSWVFHVQIDCARIVSASQDKSISIWEFGGGVEEGDLKLMSQV